MTTLVRVSALLLALTAGACSKPDPLRADLESFCAPAAAAHASAITELGPFVEPNTHSKEMLGWYDQLKLGTLSVEQFAVVVRAAMANEHVVGCPTLDKLLEKTAAPPPPTGSPPVTTDPLDRADQRR